MYTVAGNHFILCDVASVAVEGQLFHIGEGFNGGCGGHQLENGAGYIGGIKESVYINTVVSTV